MSENSSLKKYIQPVVGLLLGINLLLSAFLMVKVRRTPIMGYVDMKKVMVSLMVDIKKKNDEVMKPKQQTLQKKIEKYVKMKKNFDAKQKQMKPQKRKVKKQELENLEKKIKEEAKTINKEFEEDVEKDLNIKVKDVLEAVETIRKKNQYDLIVHEPIFICFSPVQEKARQVISIGDSHADLTKQVVDELGLKEASDDQIKELFNQK